MDKTDHMTPVQDIFNKFIIELSNHEELFDKEFIAELRKMLDESTIKESNIESLLLAEKSRGTK